LTELTETPTIVPSSARMGRAKTEIWRPETRPITGLLTVKSPLSITRRNHSRSAAEGGGSISISLLVQTTSPVVSTMVRW